MKLSSKVKDDGTRVGGSSIHAKGTFLFQFQEGFELRVKEKPTGNSYTYMVPLTSVEAIDGDPDAVGGKLNQVLNVLYNEDEVNEGGWATASAFLQYTGVVEKGADVDVKSQQLADHIASVLPGKLVIIKVGHRPRKMQALNEDTGAYEDVIGDDGKVKMIKEAFPLDILPAGQKAVGAVQQAEETDW